MFFLPTFTEELWWPVILTTTAMEVKTHLGCSCFSQHFCSSQSTEHSSTTCRHQDHMSFRSAARFSYELVLWNSPYSKTKQSEEKIIQFDICMSVCPGSEQVGGASISPDNDVFIHLAKVYSFNHASMRRGDRCTDGRPFQDGITNGYQWYPLSGQNIGTFILICQF